MNYFKISLHEFNKYTSTNPLHVMRSLVFHSSSYPIQPHPTLVFFWVPLVCATVCLAVTHYSRVWAHRHTVQVTLPSFLFTFFLSLSFLSFPTAFFISPLLSFFHCYFLFFTVSSLLTIIDFPFFFIHGLVLLSLFTFPPHFPHSLFLPSYFVPLLLDQFHLNSLFVSTLFLYLSVSFWSPLILATKVKSLYYYSLKHTLTMVNPFTNTSVGHWHPSSFAPHRDVTMYL